jgi:hypothetical protein
MEQKTEAVFDEARALKAVCEVLIALRGLTVAEAQFALQVARSELRYSVLVNADVPVEALLGRYKGQSMNYLSGSAD